MILVVEDEEMIRMVVEEALTDAGFEIVSVSTVGDAFDALSGPDRGFTGVVTDIRLGGEASGWEIARKARELRPQMAIVYVSGDSGGEWAVMGVPGSEFIQKPFAGVQISTAVSMLLNAASSTLPPK